MKKSVFLVSSVSGALALLVAGAPAASVSAFSPAAAITAEPFTMNSATNYAQPVFVLARRGADDRPGDNRGRTTRQGADDPTGHVRKGGGRDDPPGDNRGRTLRQGADDPAGHVRKGGGRDDPPGDNRGRTMKQGADDPAGHVRKGGRDDPANHA